LRQKALLAEYFKGMYDFDAKDYQLDFAYDCITSQRVVGVFCRQSGKSETCSKIALYLAEESNKTILIFAPTDRQTGLIADKIRNTISKVIVASGFTCTRQTQRDFEFNNGSKIVCETTGDKGETIRGYTADVIILEEAGTIKDTIISSVILPMGLTTNAKIIKIGTPRGKNHFFESSVDARYKVHQYDYTYAVREGLMTQEYIDEMKASTTDIIFRTEYCAEFIEDQDAFFGYELIENCKDKSLGWDNNQVEPGYTYYLGADIARLGQDSTCFTILKVKDQRAVVDRIIEIPKATLDIVIDKICELIDYYKFKRVFVDETGLGAGVTDMLAKRYNLPKLQTGSQISKFAKTVDYGDKIVGVKFTIQSKLDMFGNLKTLMQTGRIKYPGHPKLISQLRDFRYELTENMNVKLHHSTYGFDDFVDSLALAAKEVNIKSTGYSW
jgi:hypothetical protein